eukprot:7378881-Heterocapsa_arctica.AAC.1
MMGGTAALYLRLAATFCRSLARRSGSQVSRASMADRWFENFMREIISGSLMSLPFPLPRMLLI